MTRIGHSKFGFLRMTLGACVGIPLTIALKRICPELQPLSTDIGAAPTPPAAEVQRIIVRVQISDAEEVGTEPC